MPGRKTVEKAAADLRRGKSPSTAAGAFVREEIEHVRKGKHGARSPEQAIAIGLSKARRAGVPVAPPKRGKTSARTRRAAERDRMAGKSKVQAGPSQKRSRASLRALADEPRSTVSKRALSKHAKRKRSSKRAKAPGAPRDR